ncbi:MAG: hypothetical protein KGH63_04090 [Candidatus Micrarchaeota archaeon]|nr:hypothetical protein [Candidatus Micrarchaeota archaeon]
MKPAHANPSAMKILRSPAEAASYLEGWRLHQKAGTRYPSVREFCEGLLDQAAARSEGEKADPSKLTRYGAWRQKINRWRLNRHPDMLSQDFVHVRRWWTGTNAAIPQPNSILPNWVDLADSSNPSLILPAEYVRMARNADPHAPGHGLLYNVESIEETPGGKIVFHPFIDQIFTVKVQYSSYADTTPFPLAKKELENPDSYELDPGIDPSEFGRLVDPLGQKMPTVGFLSSGQNSPLYIQRLGPIVDVTAGDAETKLGIVGVPLAEGISK